jgi:hypothetical protein
VAVQGSEAAIGSFSSEKMILSKSRSGKNASATPKSRSFRISDPPDCDILGETWTTGINKRVYRKTETWPVSAFRHAPFEDHLESALAFNLEQNR